MERPLALGWLLCGMLLLGLALQPMAARADAGDSAVVIVRVPGDATIISRLRAELSSYRFRAIELADRPARRSEALSQLALQQEAQAALRAKPEAMAVELWVRAAGGAAQPSEELVSAGPARDPEVLAVRVTEAMRARGLTLPPLTAAASKPGKAPAAASGGQGSGPSGSGGAAVAPAEADVAEPHTLQPGELTEPVVKSPEPVKPAAAPATPAKPAEARAEPKAALPKADTEDKTRATQKPEAAQRPAQPGEKQRTAAEAEGAQRTTQKPEKKQRTAAEAKGAQRPSEKPEERQRADKQPARDNEPLAEAADATEVATASTRTRARDALVYLEIGPAGVLSPGPDRLGPALDLLVGLTFRPYQNSSISLVGLIPLLATDLSIEGGSVDVRTYGIGGFGDLHLPLGRVELSGGLGALALISTGLVSPEFVSEYKTQRLAALLGRVAASMALTRELHVSASIMAGLTVQQLRLQFSKSEDASASAPDATWGRPLLLGSLSIEVALPWDR